MKTKICIFSLMLAVSLPAWASLDYSSSTPVVIPDNNALGTGDGLIATLSGGSVITGVTLTFTLAGGDSTDLSGYLRLGNESGSSPFYDLTSLIQATPEGSGGYTYSIDFTTSGFSTAFNGQNPNDTWTLFFADSVPGDTTTVTGWTLDVTAVPEPVNVALGIFGGILAVGSLFYRRRNAASATVLN